MKFAIVLLLLAIWAMVVAGHERPPYLPRPTRPRFAREALPQADPGHVGAQQL